MDSINQNQEEQNHKDLFKGDSIQKIKELINSSPTCFFCTKEETKENFLTRPMTVQKVDDNGSIYFLSASDSKKNKVISDGLTEVQLLFKGSAYSDFLIIYGVAEISTDKAMIKELWKPILKDWFTEGENDTRITVVKISPRNGYYWDTKHGMMVAFIKQIAGAITGHTMDDSIEGKITL